MFRAFGPPRTLRQKLSDYKITQLQHSLLRSKCFRHKRAASAAFLFLNLETAWSESSLSWLNAGIRSILIRCSSTSPILLPSRPEEQLNCKSSGNERLALKITALSLGQKNCSTLQICPESGIPTLECGSREWALLPRSLLPRLADAILVEVQARRPIALLRPHHLPLTRVKPGGHGSAILCEQNRASRPLPVYLRKCVRPH